MRDRVTHLLHAHQIHAISGACDGAETERALRLLVAQSACPSKNYTIANSHLAKANVTFTIPLIESQHPFIAIQDSKDPLKTARNRIVTGARLLTMGNNVLSSNSCPLVSCILPASLTLRTATSISFLCVLHHRPYSPSSTAL